MRAVLLASLRSHLRRYVAVGLAVGIGVAFVVVTGAITSATRDGLSAGVAAPYVGASVVATGVDPRRLDDLHESAAEAGADLSVIGAAMVPVQPDAGLAEDLYVGEVPAIDAPGADEPRWPELLDGRFPTGDGEALVDERAAELAGVAIGDRLTIGDEQTGGPVRVEVVGTSDPGPTSAANAVYLRWDDLRPLTGTMYVEAVAWSGPGSPAEQADALGAALPDTAVISAQDHVDGMVVDANNGVDVLAIMLLLFAAVALFVAVLVIANTFAVLFAQRRRELALLRCVGATRRQLRRAVRAEALVVGSVATLVGLAAGTGLGVLVVAVVRDRVPEAGLGSAAVSWPWYAGAAAVGVLVTVLAAWLPTRRATAVAPVAALAPDDDTRLRTGAGRVRFAAGVLAVVAGGLGLAYVAITTDGPADTSASLPVMLAGGIVSFTGVLLLGPVIVPGLIRLVGAGAARLPGAAGPVTRIAADNAVRDPRRTSAATASLLVGVTLTTAVLVGLASARAVTDDDMSTRHPFDATLSGPGLPADAADRLAEVPGVDRAAALPGTEARVGRESLVVVAPDAVDDASTLSVSPDDVTQVADDEIRVPLAAFADGLALERPLRVSVGGRSLSLTPAAGDGLETFALVSPATLDRLAPAAGDAAVWLTATDGTSGEDLAADLAPLAASYDAQLTTGLANRQYIDLQLTIVTAAVVGLLGIAVVIALAGIANTLGLSVLERTRELALLRALGLTRGRLRAVLATEGVLLALVATLLGTGVGVLFGWVGSQVIIAPVVAATPLVLPWAQLGLVVLAAVLAGLLAAVLPARRAARVAPAAGLTAE